MTIRTSLMKHQDRIVDFCDPLPHFGIFAGYGVGKSLAALSIIERKGWKVNLIISTKTAIQSTWPDQITEHSDFRYVKLLGDSKQKFRTLRDTMNRYRATYHNHPRRPVLIVLVNFDGVKNIFRFLTLMKPDSVILDESTKIKNIEALRTQVMIAYGKLVLNRGVMTGFPITDSPTEIYSQIKFLDQGATFGNSYEAFLDTYFEKKKGRYVLKKGAAKKIFDKIKGFCIMIPESVIKLPPKVYKKIALDPTEEQTRLLDSLNNQFRLEFGKVQYSTKSIFALTSKAMQICDGFVTDGRGNLSIVDTPKDEAMLDTFSEIGTKEKILIFTNYIWTVKKIHKLLSYYGYGVLTLYGDTEDPGKIVKVFQNSTKYNVLVSTLMKGNESVTLTNCHLGFYYSRDWSNDRYGNSQARIRRKGSEKHGSIIYTDFLLRGTVEEVVHNGVDKKVNVVRELKKFFS